MGFAVFDWSTLSRARASARPRPSILGNPENRLKARKGRARFLQSPAGSNIPRLLRTATERGP